MFGGVLYLFYVIAFGFTFFVFSKVHKNGKLLRIDSAFMSWVVMICVLYVYLMWAMLGTERIHNDYTHDISDYTLTSDGVEFDIINGGSKTLVGDVAIVDADSEITTISYTLEHRDVDTWQNIMFLDVLFVGMWERDIATNCVITE